MCDSYQSAVVGVLDGVDNAELVEHLADDDDTHPGGGEARGHVSEACVRHGEGPQHHQHQVHYGGLADGNYKRINNSLLYLQLKHLPAYKQRVHYLCIR